MMELSLKFYCVKCDLRIDICRCQEFRDQGCWDCGPGCQMALRRETLKSIQSASVEGVEIPRNRPAHLTIPYPDVHYLQEQIYKQWWKEQKERQEKRENRPFFVRGLLSLLEA